MKKRCLFLSIICFSLFMGGCAKKEARLPPGEHGPFAANEGTTSIEKSEVPMLCKVIGIWDEAALVANLEDEHGLYQVSLDALAQDTSQIKPGDKVEIGFDGLVLEIYPPIIANPDYIKLVENGDNLVGVYHGILQDLLEKDAGLNADIHFIAVDLSKDKLLTESEKNALIYLLGNHTQIETRQGSYESLLSENLIIQDANTGFSHLEAGLLLLLETSQLDKDSFHFTAEKWRSSLGAYTLYDCLAKKENGSWSYEIGAEMIS
ncbi:hypothetical protein [Anaerotignum sp.]|uniref:hypothetical protein n=1 Tax=Anaerotignum sp. TaxID=2039241 RepID=UPI00331B968F